MKMKQALTTTPSQKAVAKLSKWRDELKLQAHLFNADAKDQWKQIEKDWQLLESEAKRLAPEAKKAARVPAATLRPLLRKLETSLQHIREGVERHHADTKHS